MKSTMFLWLYAYNLSCKCSFITKLQDKKAIKSYLGGFLLDYKIEELCTADRML